MGASDDDRGLRPGDMVVGWTPPLRYEAPSGVDFVGPRTPGIVVRVHQVKLMDSAETQEIWILREGREERWFGSELLLVERL